MNLDSRYMVIIAASLMIGIFVAPYAQSLLGTLRPSVRPPSNVPDPSLCRTDWTANLRAPEKFQLIQPCIQVTGTVQRQFVELGDGDTKVLLLPDARFVSLLNPINRQNLNGTLMVEIIPADSPFVDIPAVGTHISVIGALVVDMPKGWVEIHPAWRIFLFKVSISTVISPTGAGSLEVDVSVTESFANQTAVLVPQAFVKAELSNSVGTVLRWAVGSTSSAGNSRLIFNNLPPGEYNLKVLARQGSSSGYNEVNLTL